MVDIEWYLLPEFPYLIKSNPYHSAFQGTGTQYLFDFLAIE